MTGSHQQSDLECDAFPKSINMRERLKYWLPTDTKSFLFVSAVLVNLVVGVIHFAQTGDTTMLTHILELVGVYAGIKEVGTGVKEAASFLRRRKYEEQ